MNSSQNRFLSTAIIYFISIVFAVFSFLDFEIAGLSVAWPLFDVMMIYYFRIFRSFFSLWFIFFLGLIVDSLSGEILGVTSLTYIIGVKFFEYLEIRLAIKDEFEQVLRRFVAFLTCILLLKWLILSIANFASYNFVAILIQLVISSVCYVFMHKLLDVYYNRYIA